LLDRELREPEIVEAAKARDPERPLEFVGEGRGGLGGRIGKIGDTIPDSLLHFRKQVTVSLTIRSGNRKMGIVSPK